jgi:hypothetical protein
MPEESRSKKPRWGKPKLLTLAKGKPEEAVLVSCKSGAYGSSNSLWFGKCTVNESCPGCSVNTTT